MGYFILFYFFFFFFFFRSRGNKFHLHGSTFRKQNLKVYGSLLARNNYILDKTSLILYNTISIFNSHEKEAFKKIKKKLCVFNLPLPKMISTIPNEIRIFVLPSFCCLQKLSSWAGLEF